MAESRVTLKDIYDALNRVEDKYDRRFDNIEKDIDDLQKFQNKALGVLMVVASFVSVAINYIWNKVFSA